VLVLGTSGIVALGHIGDSSSTIGPWTGLAFDAAHGTLYPPLFDGANFGGTRYTPLQFLLYAGAAKVTGEFFVSAKIIVTLIAAGLLAFIYVAVRSIGCRRSEALVVTGVAMASDAVLIACTSVAGDSLAVLLQLGAVTTVVRRHSRRATVLAGVLCALAFLAKLSAVWAPISIGLWYAIRSRPRFALFAASYVAAAGLGILAVAVASDGRVFDILSLVSTGRTQGAHGFAIDLPRKLLRLVIEHAQAAWLVAPLALLALLAGVARRRLSLYQLAALAAVVVTLVVLTDEGAYWNHLVDLAVLVPIVAAEFVVRAPSLGIDRRFASSALFAAAAFGLATGYAFHLSPRIGGSLRGLASGAAEPEFASPPLKGLVSEHDVILSEDASIPVSRGQRPVVLDPYMLLRILKAHPLWERALIRRIDARDFTKVVLLYKLDPTSTWYTRVDFGRAVATAIERNYRLKTQTSSYWIYVPRKGSAN
jgi:hypothetical protein